VNYKTFSFSDQHEQRLKLLREKTKELEEDDWKFKPISELLGHR
jgi:hypothetical protein